jgi:hypothetical protein
VFFFHATIRTNSNKFSLLRQPEREYHHTVPAELCADFSSEKRRKLGRQGETKAMMAPVAARCVFPPEGFEEMRKIGFGKVIGPVLKPQIDSVGRAIALHSHW